MIMATIGCSNCAAWEQVLASTCGSALWRHLQEAYPDGMCKYTPNHSCQEIVRNDLDGIICSWTSKVVLRRFMVVNCWWAVGIIGIRSFMICLTSEGPCFSISKKLCQGVQA